ncbi:MAG: diguanylate cyclase [Phycisphaerae bacterium]
MSDDAERDRMVVVAAGGDGAGLAATLGGLYPDWSVTVCDTYLSGIAAVCGARVRAVLACVDASEMRVDSAIAGLREAAGPAAKLVLCCRPDMEPAARGLMRRGADDYVLYPVVGDELDAALGYRRVARWRRGGPAPAASMKELGLLAGTLSALDSSPGAIPARLAELVRVALGAAGAAVEVDGRHTSSGRVFSKPLLTAPVTRGDRVVGQVCVGPPAGDAYTAGDAEKLTHYAAVAGHVLAAAAQQRTWRRQAVTDELSGLPNRRYLYASLNRILRRASAEQFDVTLLLFDIDDFKHYNDQWGHDAGDVIIRTTAELFKQQCREHDIITRYGGDEFAVVFWDPQGPRVAGSRHPQCALDVLERFTAALRSQAVPVAGPAGSARLTISAGLATYPWHASSRSALIARADDALMQAKRAGKNRIFLIGSAGAGETG